MDVKNYWSVSRQPFWKAHYMFLDIRNELSTNVFKKYNLHVSTREEYISKDGTYKFIFCDIAKKDVETFEKCMKELRNKMIILEKTDYDKICETINNDVNNRRINNLNNN